MDIHSQMTVDNLLSVDSLAEERMRQTREGIRVAVLAEHDLRVGQEFVLPARQRSSELSCSDKRITAGLQTRGRKDAFDNDGVCNEGRVRE